MGTTLMAVVSTRVRIIGLSSVLTISLLVVNPWSVGQNTPEPRAQHQERLSTTELPAKIFSLTLPASVDSGQIPDVHHLVEFDVIGSAGQFLAVKMSQTTYLKVLAPGPGSQPVENHGDDSLDLFALPRTSVYKILLPPITPDLPLALGGGAHQPSLHFEWLDASDPRVNPDLKPRQFSVDFGRFAPGARFQVVPYDSAEGEVGDSWPAHLAVERTNFEFRIMSVVKFRKMFPADKSMPVLERALHTGSKDVEPDKLPYPSYPDSGMLLAARTKMLSGKGWHGLRWIAGLGQDDSCHPDLAYFMRGMSDDGKVFIMIRATLANSAAQHIWPDERCDADSSPKRVYDVIIRGLNRLPQDSYIPNLDQLDAVADSLNMHSQ